MMRVLGIKRVLVLFVLVVINAAAAGLLYGYLMPEQIKTERALRSERSQIGKVQGDIARLQVEFDQLEEQQARFDALRNDGFFKDQDRREAEELLQQIQRSTKVNSALANIGAGSFETNEEAAKAGHRVLVSKVDLTIAALDDVDVFHYLNLLQTHFPGHVAYEMIELNREMDVNAAVLRGIATGLNPNLVSANVQFTWRTMIPESQVRQ